jgi:hypothetical protein
MEKELSRHRPLIFLQQNHLLMRIQFFALAIGQIYASTFRMAARLQWFSRHPQRVLFLRLFVVDILELFVVSN